METLSNVRYLPELGCLIINQWVFENTFHKNTDFICSRSSGPYDYVAEWWRVNDKYQLKWKSYNEVEWWHMNNKNKHDVNVLENGTLIEEVDTIHKVLVYCVTHLHPDIGWVSRDKGG